MCITDFSLKMNIKEKRVCCIKRFPLQDQTFATLSLFFTCDLRNAKVSPDGMYNRKSLLQRGQVVIKHDSNTAPCHFLANCCEYLNIFQLQDGRSGVTRGKTFARKDLSSSRSGGASNKHNCLFCWWEASEGAHLCCRPCWSVSGGEGGEPTVGDVWEIAQTSA